MPPGAVGPLGVLPSPSSLVSIPVSMAAATNPLAVSAPTSGLTATTSLVPQPSSAQGIWPTTFHPTRAIPSLPQLPVSVAAPPDYLARPGLILSPASDPFPQPLVQRVQSGQFVEMRDLLADNIALLSQLSSLHGAGTVPITTVQRTSLREVPSLISWIYCFTAYVAIRTPDQLTRQMLAYARLIIREALRHGGAGWAEYDRVFRRQVSINALLPWNTLEPSLQAATILGQRSSEGTFCSLCQECDHLSHQCALAPLQQQLQPAAHRPPRRVETLQRICVAWNKGTCFRHQCSFRHTCATCQKGHKARDCPDTPPESEYKTLSNSVPRARK